MPKSGARQDDGMMRMRKTISASDERPALLLGWNRSRSVYQRRPICCILAGDTDCGGLDMLMPVLGLTIGMALRIRVAAGWCSLRDWGWLWYEGIYGCEFELRENPESGATWWDCGLDSGDPLDSDDRSDDDEWIETMSLSVRRLGQNSKSSSRSKERPASKRCRKFVTTIASSSFLALRYCLCEFCDKRGALRPRPLWCDEVDWVLAEVGCWWLL